MAVIGKSEARSGAEAGHSSSCVLSEEAQEGQGGSREA